LILARGICRTPLPFTAFDVSKLVAFLTISPSEGSTMALATAANEVTKVKNFDMMISGASGESGKREKILTFINATFS
jgi:hypothetical protein